MDQIIEIKGLYKKFRKRILFQDLNFAVETGKTIGIAGVNGCGKSVLLKIIAGLYSPDSGSVIVRGKEIGSEADFPEKTGILINTPGFLENDTGFQNLKYLAEINHKAGDQAIKDAMEITGLKYDERLKVKHYSTGMKQKLGIAQAIMEGQDLLLLDEVFNGLDFQSANEIKKLLKTCKQQNFTILLTSHVFSDLKELCDQIYVIDEYKIRDLKQSEFKNYMS